MVVERLLIAISCCLRFVVCWLVVAFVVCRGCCRLSWLLLLLFVVVVVAVRSSLIADYCGGCSSWLLIAVALAVVDCRDSCVCWLLLLVVGSVVSSAAALQRSWVRE